MKMYQFKNILSVICTLIGIFCLVISVLCLKVWHDTMYGIIGAMLTAAYLIIGICTKIGADEDKEEYIDMHKYVKERYYDKLSVLYHKHFWKLGMDCQVPYFKDKKAILEWAADMAMACHTYMFDYDTENLDPKLNQELQTMTELAQEIIDNKKYL